MTKVQEESDKSAKNDEFWQMPYDIRSLINGGNNKKIIFRSYKPIKKGEL